MMEDSIGGGVVGGGQEAGLAALEGILGGGQQSAGPEQNESEAAQGDDPAQEQAKPDEKIPGEVNPLADRAKAVGLSDEVLAKLGDSAEQVIGEMEVSAFKNALEHGKAASAAQPGGEQKQEQPQQAAPQQPAPAPAGAIRQELQQLLKDAEYGEDDNLYVAVDRMAALLESVESRIAQQQSAIESYQQAQQAAELAAQTSEIDGFFAGMAEKYGDILGNKPVSAYQTDSPEVAKRNEIVTHAYAMIDGFAAQGKPVPSLSKALEMSARITLADHDQKAARDALAKKINTRVQGMVSRPGTQSEPRKQVPQGQEAGLEVLGKILARTSN